MNYYQKYLKYKQKYLKLKSQHASGLLWTSKADILNYISKDKFDFDNKTHTSYLHDVDVANALFEKLPNKPQLIQDIKGAIEDPIKIFKIFIGIDKKNISNLSHLLDFISKLDNKDTLISFLKEALDTNVMETMKIINKNSVLNEFLYKNILPEYILNGKLSFEKIDPNYLDLPMLLSAIEYDPMNFLHNISLTKFSFNSKNDCREKLKDGRKVFYIYREYPYNKKLNELIWVLKKLKENKSQKVSNLNKENKELITCQIIKAIIYAKYISLKINKDEEIELVKLINDEELYCIQHLYCLPKDQFHSEIDKQLTAMYRTEPNPPFELDKGNKLKLVLD